MKKKSLILFLFLTFSSVSLLEGGLPVVKNPVLKNNMPSMESASILTISLPEKSKAVLKKLFPSVQLEMGEVPDPYHHAGREKLFV